MSETDVETEDGTEATEDEPAPEFSWTGFMRNLLPYGTGVATYSNGDKYEGQYVLGKRNGKGKYTFKNGATYDGQYVENLKTGFGIMNYPDKSKYEGSWKEDKKHGLGAYTYANGDSYKGEWVTDQKDGVGIYYFHDSKSLEWACISTYLDASTPQPVSIWSPFLPIITQFEGNWDKGNFIKGRWILRNGDIFEGEFDKNLPDGPGKYRFASTNNTLEGFYEKGAWTFGDYKPTAPGPYMLPRKPPPPPPPPPPPEVPPPDAGSELPKAGGEGEGEKSEGEETPSEGDGALSETPEEEEEEEPEEPPAKKKGK